MGFPFLPDMWISADVEASEFLSRLKYLARQLSYDGIDNNIRIGQLTNASILTFAPTEHDIPEKLRFVLSSENQENKRIFVDIEANDWLEAQPEYEEYTAIAIRFIVPLLKVYNKRYRSNRRLYVQKKDQLTPKLKYTAQLFDNFISKANKSFLGRRGWRHFYKFIICCHRRNEYVAEEELEFLLRQAGFRDYYCERLCEIFEHGWAILEELPDSKLKAWRRKMREQDRKEACKSRPT